MKRMLKAPILDKVGALLTVANLSILISLQVWSCTVYGQASAPTFVSDSDQRKIFFDAKSTGFTRSGDKQFFRGEVVAIGAGVIITADEIFLDNQAQVISANGHVILITASQVFTGSTVEFDFQSGDLKMSEATMLSNDAIEAQRISREILGFTPQEIRFEEERKSRLSSIDEKKQALRQRFKEISSQQLEPSSYFIDQYGLLLEQELLIKGQLNHVFANMPEGRRSIYQSRRNYWQQGRLTSAQRGVASKTSAYFRLQGKKLTRTHGNDYHADSAVWSPCACEQDESPAWAFRAKSVDAQIGGYVNLRHPVLEIKGVPILYLPYLKLPVKSERQSGFLMPVFVQESRSGSIYSQPVYFVLSENQDATFTIDLNANRGTKGAVEYRYQHRKHSGWTLKLESIRDRLWLDDINTRSEVQEAQYTDCSLIESSEEKLDCEDAQQTLQSQLGAPVNTWRGAQIWRGMHILSDRVSLVSHGEIYSDHRYIEELILPDAFKDTFEIGHRATYFTTAKAKLNFDGSNLFLGLASKYGDNFALKDHFAGYQLPISVVAQSRLFSLLPNNAPFTLYGSARADVIEIDASRSAISAGQTNSVSPGSELGDGSWKRARFDLVSPVISNGIAKVDFFSDLEGRHITHLGMPENQSHMLSSRTGLTVNVPLDGEVSLPNWMRSQYEMNDPDARYLHHLMNWSLTFSSRPFVLRDGLYGQAFEANLNQDDILTTEPGLTYFASDRDAYDVNTTDAVANENLMRPHRRVILSTSHRWRSFSRGWKVQPATPKKKSDAERTESLFEQAKRELKFSTDQPVTDLNSLFTETEKGPVWHVNRYALQNYDAQDHLNVSASVSYDFLLAKERERQISENVEESQLERPWSNPIVSASLTAGSVYFSGSAIYDIYDTKWLSSDFGLSLPSLYSTAVGFVYEIDNRPENQIDGSSIYRRTTERSIRVGSSYIPNFRIDLDLRDRRMDIGDPTYQSRFNIRYESPSRCWQLDFVRTKAFGLDEEQAKYLLQLTVLFMGQSRQLPAMHQSIMKQLSPNRQQY